DNFFELGGDSILGIQIISRVRELFQVDLPLHYVFEYPTIADFATAVEQSRQNADEHLEILPLTRIHNKN
ncbi:phosphopantetheine-binding protein, partial [Nostoc sp. CCY 9925]|uniref:phosphopantetheine-binding protein n=1 Tax=Nostoc sp. CCY 9925 TaxID=3103865 RepID=UPI0039C5C916